MRTFEYERPSTLDSVSAALASDRDVRVLAGGMTLIPSMKMRLATPDTIVDLGGIPELVGVTADDEVVAIGAMTTHARVAGSEEVRRSIPALAELAGAIGDPQVRNRGTIGGSVANNDPASDYPAALLALNATVHTNRRSVPAASFFTGMFETALDVGEIVTRVSFPVPLSAAYEKFRSPASRYALVGVFVAVTREGVRVAVTGAAPCVFRATTIESTLAERFGPDALENFRFPREGLNDDMHGDAAYRAHLVTVLARKAVGRIVASSGSR
ncbi:MAG: carbon monoxide dehydrogenase [Betaproteobacteria bacterium]|nr:carbon monoxide dehydrogenase [Betaproteobacteria bacterium]